MEDERESRILSETARECQSEGVEALRIAYSTEAIDEAHTEGEEPSVDFTSETKLYLEGVKDGKLGHLIVEEPGESPDSARIARDLIAAIENGRPYSRDLFIKTFSRLGKSDSYSAKLDQLPEGLTIYSARKVRDSAVASCPHATSVRAEVRHWVGHTTMHSYDSPTDTEPSIQTYRRDGLRLKVIIEAEKDGEKIRTSHRQSIHKSLDNLDEVKFGSDAGKDCENRFGATPVESYSGDVLLCPAASAYILYAACTHLDGNMIYKGESVYCGKLGTDVFSDQLTVLNDPFIASDYARPFDWEGTPTEKFMAIDHGRLRCLFLDNQFAFLLDMKSNGCHNLDDCAPQYLVVTQSDRHFMSLWSELKDGIVVEEIYTERGTFDPLTLEFTLPFSGGLLQDGKRIETKKGTLKGRADRVVASIKAVSKEREDHFSCLAPWFLVSDIEVTA